MTLRYSLVLIGSLSLAGACLAIDRTPSAVEVEESEESESTQVAARPSAERLEIEVGAEPPDADDEEVAEEVEPEPAPAPKKKAAKKKPAPVVEEAPVKKVARKAPKAPVLDLEPSLPDVAPEVPAAAPEAPIAQAEPEAPAAPALAPAQAERLKAFAKGPLKFTSVGKVKAFMIKMDRNLEYTLEPVQGSEKVAVTMVDHANGDKVVKGELDVTKSGALRASDLPLTNACNIGSIDPVARKKLLAGDDAVVTKGQMEVSGNVVAIEATHRREGDVAADGSMKVRSESESADGKVKLVTITELAADGLPTLAETTGTIAKGPINLNVNLKLTREVEHSSIGE